MQALLPLSAAARKRLPAALTAALVLLLVVKAWLLTRMILHWDEFLYLSRVYKHLRGELGTALQNVHVHLFGWLGALPGYEIEQIVAARLTLQATAVAASILLIYGLARRFLPPVLALASLLAWLSMSEVVWHSGTFRADTLALPLLLLAVWLPLRREDGGAALTAGISAGLAMLVTIKSALFAPPIAMALAAPALAERNWRRAALLLALAGLSAGLVFAAGYLLGSAGAAAGLQRDADYLAQTRQAALGLYPDRLLTLAESIGNNPVAWALLCLGLVQMAAGWKDRGRQANLLLVSLCLPLASTLFYRNAFSYFYPMLMAFAAPLFGLGLARLAGQVADKRRVPLIAALAAVLTATGLWHGRLPPEHRLDAQRQVLRAVHEIFPRPVPYIDRNGMVASFPKAGFFMSNWEMERYRDRGQPVFARLMAERRPVFLLANTPDLDLGDPGRSRLMAEDMDVLAANFVHHWGPLWVQGRRLRAGSDTVFAIAVPGPYTLEADAPVAIDGRQRGPGEVLDLAQGRHSLAGPPGARVTLRWGAHLPRPQAPPPSLPLFVWR